MATRIKHCGITSLDDAHRAAEAGAWALGMIFWDGSPRRCALDEAQLIGSALRRTVNLVGVFVNARLEEIDAVVQATGLSHVQLHGDEGPVFCGEIARRTGAKVIKAVRVQSRATLQAAVAFHTDFLLLDAHVEGVPGGTGRTLDWELVRAARLVPPVILSGGLAPDNVAAAVAGAEPFAVAAAGGPGGARGVKARAGLQASHAAVRSADEREQALGADDAAASAAPGERPGA